MAIMTRKYSLDHKDVRRIIEITLPLTQLGKFKVGSMFCPFHLNTDTPAAQFHNNDADGIQRIWCFSCKRQYTSYDYLTKILKQDAINYIYTYFTPDQIQEILASNCTEIDLNKVDHIDNAWSDADEDIHEFLKQLYQGYNIY